jgi:glycosyltransferase involved in cell wall biosynthesis
MNLTSEDVLFVGRGPSVVSWYRTGMPAFNLGCDWMALEGKPPNLRMVASLKRGGHVPSKLDRYKIVILQQVAGSEWLREIRRLQNKGVKVVYEVDDYLHGVRKVKSHRAREAFSKKRLAEFELCMRVCDAIIVSTQRLKRLYGKFNPHVYVCRNFIEERRYRFELPERKMINIGWAGGEGHLEAVQAWLPAIGAILEEYPETRFVSMGLPVADLLDRHEQAISLPFISIENFPAALTNFDLAIAPAGRGAFYAAKSDLRWLETGALGIPLVADPFVYGDLEHDVTGIVAETAGDVVEGLKLLIEDADKRKKISENVRKHVLEERSIEPGVSQWENVFISVADQS